MRRFTVIIAGLAFCGALGCDNKPGGPGAPAGGDKPVAKADPAANPTPDDGEPVGVYLPKNPPTDKPRRPMAGEPFADYDSSTTYRGKASEKVFIPSTPTPPPPSDQPKTTTTKPVKETKPVVPPPPAKPKEHLPDKTAAQWVEQLKAEDAKSRAQAAFALAKLGAEAKVALPALKAALRDKDDGVRAAVEFALKKIPL